MIRMPFYPAIAESRELADARKRDKCAITCEVCKHTVWFQTPEERRRFIEPRERPEHYPGWVPDLEGNSLHAFEVIQGLCPVCQKYDKRLVEYRRAA